MTLPYITPPEPQGKFLPVPENKSSVPDTVLRIRSAKYNYAMGEDSPGEEAVFSNLQTGNESFLRDKLASQRTLDLQKEKGRWLEEIAGAQEGPLTKDQFNFIQGLTQEQMVDPETVLESEYGKKLFTELYSSDNEDSLANRALSEDPAKANSLEDIGSEIIGKQELISKKGEELQAGIKALPAVFGVYEGRVDEFLETMIPFKSWNNLSVEIEGLDAPFLLGATMKEKVDYLWSRPTPEFSRLFTATVDTIAKTNLYDAVRFVEAVNSYSTSDQLWGNIESVLDISSIVPATTAYRLGKFAVRDMNTAVRGTVTQNAGKINITDTLAAAGKSEEAAIVQTMKNLKTEAVRSRDPFHQMDTLLSRTPSFVDPIGFVKGPTKMVREQVSRLENIVQRTSGIAKKGLTDRATLARMSESQNSALVQQAAQSLRREFPHINNSLMDIARVKAENSPSNVDTFAFRFKRPDGTAFQTREEAQYWADNEFKFSPSTPDLRSGSEYTVIPLGDGYGIQVLRNGDEISEPIKDMMIGTDNVTPANSVNALLSKVRSSEYLLAPEHMATRQRMTYGIQELARINDQIAEPLYSLSNRSKKRFQRFTTMLRDMPRRDGSGDRGDFFSTLGEFEEAWQSAFNRLPTVKESAAYHSYLTLNDLEYTLRNLSIYAGKARRGTSNFQLTVGDTLTPMVEGKFIPRLDLETLPGNANILVWDQKGVEKAVVTKADIQKNENLKKSFEEMQTGNYRVFEIASPETRPLMESTGVDDLVNFVVTKDYKNSPLDVAQLPYRPGGHVVYDYGWKVAQPRITNIKGRRILTHDTTLTFGNSEKEVRKAAKALEEARQLYRKGLESKDPKTFNDFVSKNLPYSPKELRGMFEDGRLSVTEPITFTKMGSRTIDDNAFRSQLGDFEDARDSPFNLNYDINREFSGERGYDLSGIKEGRLGTDESPLFQLEKPQLLDPLSTIVRAANSMARSSFLEDYRRFASERFIEEFWDQMTVSKEKLRQNPLGALYKPQWNENSANGAKLAAGKNFQKATLSLMNVRTPAEKNWLKVKEKLYESIYDNTNLKTADFIDDHLLHFIENPIQHARAAVSHLRIGMFVPRQFAQQAQTLTNVYGMVNSPTIALKATSSYPLVRYLLNSSESAGMIEHYANIASKIGWNKDHFKEAYDFYRRSGVNQVDGSSILKDDSTSLRMFSSKFGRWFDKASPFFWREGERVNRITAFMSAYLEWRADNPLAKLSRKAEMQIVHRQGKMTVGMTRAEEAWWSKGWVSLPTQFYAYNAKIAEQLWDFGPTAPSMAKKARIVGTYAAMYGIPIGVGGTILPIYPWYEDIREDLVKRGISMDNAAVYALHNGLVSSMWKWVTGKEIAFGEAEGPRSLHIIKDFMNDKPYLQTLLGASGGVADESLKSVYPVFSSLQEVLTNPGRGEMTVLSQDFGTFAKTISSVNSAYKLYYGLNYGKIISKGEMILDDITPFETVMSSVFGINSQRFEDKIAGMRELKDIKGAQEGAEKQVVKYLRRWLDAKNGGDQELADAEETQVHNWMMAGDIRPDRFADLVTEAARGGYAEILDEVNQKMLLDNPLASGSEDRRKLYEQQQQ